MELKDICLQGRKYTWSNNRETPSFVRLVRFLISNAWTSLFPNTSQHALASPQSDHYPIFCKRSTEFPLPNTFRLENFWLKLPEFKHLIANTWSQQAIAQNPKELQGKFIRLRKAITEWRNDRIG
jgi:hypothetical protein